VLGGGIALFGHLLNREEILRGIHIEKGTDLIIEQAVRFWSAAACRDRPESTHC